MHNRSHRATPLAVAILLALSATTQAQDNQQAGQAESGVKELDKVVVTGSSIPRTDTETASPVQVCCRYPICVQVEVPYSLYTVHMSV